MLRELARLSDVKSASGLRDRDGDDPRAELSDGIEDRRALEGTDEEGSVASADDADDG